MKMIQSRSKKFVSIAAMLFMVLFGFMASGCGGGGSSGVDDGGVLPPPPAVVAPGAPTNFTVVATPDALLSATLSWEAPTTGGAVETYEIYRSTTKDNILDPANHIGSISAVEGQTSYEFIDNAGLEYDLITYWIVVAKNAGGETPTLPADYTPVEPPGVPMNFTVVENKGGQDLSATLTWNVPTTGSAPTSYEIYRGTTPGSVFDPDYHLISIPVVEGDTSYVYIDNAGLVQDVNTSYVVAAKNANGETPTSEESILFTTGEVEAYGNNFAAAMIFADDYGITGELIPDGSVWTKDNLAAIVYETGLRPSINQTLASFPYYDPDTVFNEIYYKQQTVSTWQGEWKTGEGADQNVTATFGDNLISQTLTSESKIRIEVVLTKDLNASQEANMTSYNMVSLYGGKFNEIYGTDRTEYNNTKAFVFATNAHLKIQKVGEANPLYDQPLLSGCGGMGCFASEVNVAGNHTYGFVWDLANDNPGYDKKGTWRITFSLDGTSVPTGTSNHTFIDDVAPTEAESEGGTLPVRVSDTEVYIDITIN